MRIQRLLERIFGGTCFRGLGSDSFFLWEFDFANSTLQVLLHGLYDIRAHLTYHLLPPTRPPDPRSPSPTRLISIKPQAHYASLFFQNLLPTRCVLFTLLGSFVFALLGASWTRVHLVWTRVHYPLMFLILKRTASRSVAYRLETPWRGVSCLHHFFERAEVCEFLLRQGGIVRDRIVRYFLFTFVKYGLVLWYKYPQG